MRDPKTVFEPIINVKNRTGILPFAVRIPLGAEFNNNKYSTKNYGQRLREFNDPQVVPCINPFKSSTTCKLLQH